MLFFSYNLNGRGIGSYIYTGVRSTDTTECLILLYRDLVVYWLGSIDENPLSTIDSLISMVQVPLFSSRTYINVSDTKCLN